MRKLSRIQWFGPAAFAFATFCASNAHAAAVVPPASELSTSNIQIAVSASSAQPHLVWISGPAGLSLRNRAPEQLPSSVEINGASVPLKWQHRPELDAADSRRVVFVYESAQPHLRLRWEWQARADFGAIEHRIVIENLGDKEAWLPMIDSLSLDWVIRV